MEHVWNNAHEGLLLIMGTGMPKTWQRISEVEGGNMTKQEYHFYDKPSPWFHIPANCPFGHKINVKSLRGKLTRGWTWLRLVDTHLQSMFQPCLGSHKENIATVFMKIMKTFCASKIPLPKISFKKIPGALEVFDALQIPSPSGLEPSLAAQHFEAEKPTKISCLQFTAV